MVNNEINAEVVNLVDNEKGGVTQMKLSEALKIAEEAELDLICIDNRKEVPTVKLGNYSKYLYEKQKREKENKKKARVSQQKLKEIQIRDFTAEHDICVKAKQVDRIINEGDKVRLLIKYTGKMIRSVGDGPDRLRHLVSKLESKFIIDRDIKIEGNTVSMIVAPNNKKVK